MHDTFYKEIVQQLRTAYAYHKIICTDAGIPCDYEFIEVNTEFEKLTGLKGADIIGKLVSEVLPGLKTSSFDWISIHGDVASELRLRRLFESVKDVNVWRITWND